MLLYVAVCRPACMPAACGDLTFPHLAQYSVYIMEHQRSRSGSAMRIQHTHVTLVTAQLLKSNSRDYFSRVHLITLKNTIYLVAYTIHIHYTYFLSKLQALQYVLPVDRTSTANSV